MATSSVVRYLEAYTFNAFFGQTQTFNPAGYQGRSPCLVSPCEDRSMTVAALATWGIWLLGKIQGFCDFRLDGFLIAPFVPTLAEKHVAFFTEEIICRRRTHAVIPLQRFLRCPNQHR